MIEPTKVCTKCGVEYPATKEFFYAHKTGKYGVLALCKKCHCKRSKKWRAENPEKAMECSKKWNTKNPQKVKLIQKKYCDKNYEKLRENNRKWQSENPEKHRECSKKWQAENTEKVQYIQTKQRLKKQIGATPPPELVEIKVLINKTKKLCKTLNS